MKEQYSALELELIAFENTDVIVTSYGDDNNDTAKEAP